MTGAYDEAHDDDLGEGSDSARGASDRHRGTSPRQEVTSRSRGARNRAERPAPIRPADVRRGRRRSRRLHHRPRRSVVQPAPSSRVRPLTVRTLVDTGPLVALLNRRDRYHRWAVAQVAEERVPLWTCEAVITEACFLLRGSRGGTTAIWELLEREAV